MAARAYSAPRSPMRENVRPKQPATPGEVFPPMTKVWLPDAKLGFVPGQVTSSPLMRGREARVLVETQKHNMPTEFLLSASASHQVESFDVSMNEQDPPHDLADLGVLNNASLLHALRLRFQAQSEKKRIYTSIGDVLISLNPYETISNMYSTETMDVYLADQAAPPHVYKAANRVYKLARQEIPQTVIFSGESGSGKTEATKIFTSFLAHASSRADASQAAAVVRERLMQATPLIEAFGNAATERNYNSSRFGTYATIHFENGVIKAAKLENLLLEKTRVVFHAQGERNYHIFYQVATTLETGRKFRYIDAAECRLEQDAKGLEVTLNSMRVCNIEPNQVIELVHGLLELGNVEFTGTEVASIADDAQLAGVARLLHLEAAALSHALLVRDVSNGREAVSAPHTLAQATAARDSLAKHVYGRLFDWLVQGINKGVAPSQPEMTLRETVSLLDTFGFESLANNSLEQLCINYCNERLNLFFSQACVRAELATLAAEKVSTAHLDFGDNQACIDLFEAPVGGLLAMIDDELKVPGGCDDNLLVKMRDRHAAHEHFYPHVSEQRHAKAKVVFGVKHYAGTAWYDTTGFLAKSRDALPVSLERLCASSGEGLIGRELFAESGVPALAARAEAKASRGIRFRDELNGLMTRMSQSNTSWVRCIKPNAKDQPGDFNGALVLEQLMSAGVLHACIVRKEGYAVRVGKDTFLSKYACLAPEFARHGVDSLANELARRYGGELGLQVGTTRVFATQAVTQRLDQALSGRTEIAATRIQARFRGSNARREVKLVLAWVRRLSKAVEKVDEAAMDELLRNVPALAKHLPLVRRAEQLTGQLSECAVVEAQLRFAIEANSLDALAAAVSEASSVRDVRGTLAPLLGRAKTLLGEAQRLEATRAELRRVLKFNDMELLSKAVANAEAILPVGDHVLVASNKHLDALAVKRIQRAIRRKLFADAVKAVLAEAGDVEGLNEDDAQRVRHNLQRAKQLGIEDHPFVRTLAARWARLEEKMGIQRRPEFMRLAEKTAWGRRTLATGVLVNATSLGELSDAIIDARMAKIPGDYLLHEAQEIEGKLRDRMQAQQTSKSKKWWASSCCGSSGAAPRARTSKSLPQF